MLSYGGRRRATLSRKTNSWSTVWAFHVSADGAYWDLLRYFSLGEGSGARIGFLAQSPMGHGCTAVFDAISYKVGAPANLRDGT